MSALKALILKDKAWLRSALDHLRSTLFRDSAGGRVPDAAAVGANDQRRRLFGFDLGKSVGLELAPLMQMLAELMLCSQGEEVRAYTRWHTYEAWVGSFRSSFNMEEKKMMWGAVGRSNADWLRRK